MKFLTVSAAAALTLALGVSPGLSGLSPALLTAQEKYPDGAPKLDYEGQPIAVKAVRAFPKLKIQRPIVLTNFGDGSDRLAVATQYGSILVMPNDESVTEPAVFLDMEEKVSYKDKENEEGFLGLAFHPKYAENGEFFVYYTTSAEPHVSIISRFKRSQGDANKADPASEEILMKIPQPYWNHNGGTLAFGPDGYLYVGLGDGGSGRDPHGNGQNLGTLLGKILRIDVDHKDEGLAYAIPKDNPFVGKEGAAPEIFALGVRNIWRLSFDRQTGLMFAADVGQDLWEEIDVVHKGDNLGWSLREGFHPFGEKGVGPRADLVEPIWEYPHEVGKSITGGYVYRGKKAPELVGKYLYADYVTNRVWALDYDQQAKKVLGNYKIEHEASSLPVITYGEDEAGEVYFTTSSHEIFKFVPTK